MPPFGASQPEHSVLPVPVPLEKENVMRDPADASYHPVGGGLPT